MSHAWDDDDHLRGEAERLRQEADDAGGPPWWVDLNAPYDNAPFMLELQYTVGGLPVLHNHRGVFYHWDGASYAEVSDRQIRANIYNFLNQCVTDGKPDKNGNIPEVPVKPNDTMVNKVFDALSSAAILDDQLEPPVWLGSGRNPVPQDLIACRNGLLHLSTGDLLPPTPRFFTMNAVGFDYDPDAPEPKRWLEFLEQLWPDDSESVDTLQEIFGYMLTPDTSQQKVFMVNGPKRCGKGTIGRVATALIGLSNTVAQTLHAMSETFGLQPFIGKSMAVVSDARIGKHLDLAAVAERILSISGEDTVTVNRKNHDFWTGQLKTRFLILTNLLLNFRDVSGAVTSRFIVLKLRESFLGREDTELTGKLLEELPGILNWSIAGLKRLRKRKRFVQPRSALEMIDQLEELSSPEKAFGNEFFLFGANCIEDIGQLFGAWKGWCQQTGRKDPGTVQNFCRNLRDAFPDITVHQHKNGERFYRGIQLRKG